MMEKGRTVYTGNGHHHSPICIYQSDGSSFVCVTWNNKEGGYYHVSRQREMCHIDDRLLFFFVFFRGVHYNCHHPPFKL